MAFLGMLGVGAFRRGRRGTCSGGGRNGRICDRRGVSVVFEHTAVPHCDEEIDTARWRGPLDAKSIASDTSSLRTLVPQASAVCQGKPVTRIHLGRGIPDTVFGAVFALAEFSPKRQTCAAVPLSPLHCFIECLSTMTHRITVPDLTSHNPLSLASPLAKTPTFLLFFPLAFAFSSAGPSTTPFFPRAIQASRIAASSLRVPVGGGSTRRRFRDARRAV